MKQKIKAIYNEDMEGFLEKVGELKEIQNGNRFCEICGTPISIQNIQIVIPLSNNQFKYVCDSITCVEQYNEIKK